MSRSIILASSSPRRSMLLSKLGVPFTVEPSSYEEDLDFSSDPFELVEFLATGKANAVAHHHSSGIIVGADSIVFFNGKVYGKPLTHEKAMEMLRELNGSEHSIITGVCLIDIDHHKKIIFSEETRVIFHQVSEKELRTYVDTGEPLDKAGAYALQEKGVFLIKKIMGDRDNAIGLPVQTLRKKLSELSIDLPSRK